MNEPRFGPAGNAESFSAAGYKKSEDAPAWLAQMGLTAYEYQCGRGVHVGAETAGRIGAAARKNGIQMSIHAPYFINLSSEEHERMEKNVQYVLDTARVAAHLGAVRMVVHCGGQGKLTRERAMKNSHENVRNILRALEEERLTGCTVCLETMGKRSVLGSAEEVCELVAADDRLLPCIDFGHLNARTGGGMNSRAAYAALFDLMENTIGAARTSRFHAHFSRIEYNDKGEIRHLTFASDPGFGPDFAPLAEEVARRGYAPTFICESAGTQAEDAVTMSNLYKGATQK
ncbi:TIM barrel protein [Agathobaculum sp.]|uniref:TIM barrel protein n=1 Tax=Agathobaculum sp. TaxID=2048138 RepID=UPI002A7FE6C6|nr:TIM barrel protein [Agathobaculum sp.]MDY3619432.1 TIM barrel protein [Agathobaculum sp.]